jgi:tetratricopeptide (TPR) repeat protein
MRFRVLGMCLLSLSLALSATPAVSAKPSSDAVAAKKAVAQGKKQEKKKDYDAAREAYQQALELDDKPTTRLKLAKVEEKLGHLIEAADNVRRALESKKLSYYQRRSAKKTLKKLEKSIPTLTLELPAGFEGHVWVDDEELGESERTAPVAVNPGTRQVRAEADGYLPYKESFDVAESETKAITVLLSEAPPEKPAEKPVVEKDEGSGNTKKTLGYVSLAVGGAGLVVGTAMGLAARSTKNELDSSCLNNVCSDNERDLYDKGKTQANIATAGFVVGGIGLGLGAFFLLTADGGEKKNPSAEARTRIVPVLSPRQVGVVGRF